MGLNDFEHLRLAKHKHNSGALPEAHVYRLPPQARILQAEVYIWGITGFELRGGKSVHFEGGVGGTGFGIGFEV